MAWRDRDALMSEVLELVTESGLDGMAEAMKLLINFAVVGPRACQRVEGRYPAKGIRPVGAFKSLRPAYEGRVLSLCVRTFHGNYQ